MIRRHPRTSVLQAWLNSDAELPRVTAHVADCHRCANRIEQLAADDPDASAVGPALVSLLDPPADLATRVEGNVTDRLTARQLAVVLADLYGAGLETSKLLLSEEDL